MAQLLPHPAQEISEEEYRALREAHEKQRERVQQSYAFEHKRDVYPERQTR